MASAVADASGRRCGRAERVGGGVHSWVRPSNYDEKIRETGGPLALDGRHSVGGHNNQIAVDESGVRGDEGERRPGWSVLDGAVASVRPSN